MLPILFSVIAGVAGATIIKELLTGNHYSDKSDLHDQFLQFEKNISVSRAKIDRLIRSRKALESRIKTYFKSHPDIPVPSFYIQGSYKMKTMILDNDDSYDVDLGIYFLARPDIEPFTLQKYVLDAVKGHTSGVQHRDKCVRVIYKGEFDIDLPIYYKLKNDKHPFLATKYGWLESDPKQLCDWFNSKKDNNGQLVRIVKYLKAWANFGERKMPSGIALTVWVANNFKPHERDDISFLETVKAIKDSFFWSLCCKNPAAPYDDFLYKLDDDQKDNFKRDLNELIKNGKLALGSDDAASAHKLWLKEFGPAFPTV